MRLWQKRNNVGLIFFGPILLVGNARMEEQSNIKVNDCKSGKKKNVLVRLTTVDHTAMVVKGLTEQEDVVPVLTTLVGRSEYRPSFDTTLVGRSEYRPSSYIYGPLVEKNTLKWGKH